MNGKRKADVLGEFEWRKKEGTEDNIYICIFLYFEQKAKYRTFLATLGWEAMEK
jgi:hypothetical protein